MNKVLALSLLAGLSTVAFAQSAGNIAFTTVPASAMVYAPVTLSSANASPLYFGKVVSLDTSKPLTIALNDAGGYDTRKSANMVPFWGVGSANPTIPTVKATMDRHLPVAFGYLAAVNKGALVINSATKAPMGQTSFNLPIYGNLTVPANTLGKVHGTVIVVAAYL